MIARFAPQLAVTLKWIPIPALVRQPGSAPHLQPVAR